MTPVQVGLSFRTIGRPGLSGQSEFVHTLVIFLRVVFVVSEVVGTREAGPPLLASLTFTNPPGLIVTATLPLLADGPTLLITIGWFPTLLQIKVAVTTPHGVIHRIERTLLASRSRTP